MTTFTDNKDFFKLLSYKGEPRWFNIFIHAGFGAAILLAVVALILTYWVY